MQHMTCILIDRKGFKKIVEMSFREGERMDEVKIAEPMFPRAYPESRYYAEAFDASACTKVYTFKLRSRVNEDTAIFYEV